MTPEVAFGAVLKDLRTSKNISQERLALEGDLDRTFISLLERGLRQPSLSTIFQISSALKIEASQLVSLVEKMLDATNNEEGQ